jgi:hypothetical protein
LPKDRAQRRRLAVTALTSNAIQRMAREAGCDAVLCKPVVASIVVNEAQLLVESRRR